MSDEVVIEVVFARPDVQALLIVSMEQGATANDALERSGIYDRFPDDDLRALPIGIWGRRVGPDYVLGNGDRIELYRPLQIDPREVRRRLAQSGRTMGQSFSE